MRKLRWLNGFIVSINKGKIEIAEAGLGNCYMKRRGSRKKEVILKTIEEFLDENFEE